MQRKRARLIAFIAAPLLLAIYGPGVARAQIAPDYYKGKSVDIIVGYETGGGYDVYARLLARHMGRHLPGQPGVVVKNMPGAVSRAAGNYIASVAAKDGMAIATIARGLPQDELLGAPGIRFRSADFLWLGSMNNEVSVGVAWQTSTVKTIQEAMQKEMMVGAIADSLVFPTVTNAVLGTKFKIITGYRSGGELSLAMERGELEGRMGWSWSSIQSTNPDWIRDKRIINLVQFSTSRHADLPDVPLVTELAKNAEDRALLELVFARQVMGRPFLAPGGMSKDVNDALRNGFDASMKDPQLLADAVKVKLEVNPVSGAEVQELVRRMFSAPASVVARAKELVPVEK
jgi:tripartite-type tricarboxylate transporter receptor subunit TctC